MSAALVTYAQEKPLASKHPGKNKPSQPAPPDDVDFAELDAVLSEHVEHVDADTGSDLPHGIADTPTLGSAEEPPELPPPDWVLPGDEPLPPDEPRADNGSVLDDKTSFTSEAQRLARAREWQSLAGLTSAALDHSPWASQPETRIALITDLARLYRDRLRDLPSAEDQFRRLLELAPADPEPNRFLAQRYREREDWRALYDLRLAALDATWNPEQRLEWTREAARIASTELHAEELAIAAWERLWRSGDAPEEATRALSDSYRRAGEWDRLGEFLVRRADELKGPAAVVVLREAAEAYLTGDRNHDRATAVLERILNEASDDVVALLSLARVYARRLDWAALAQLGTRIVPRGREAAFLDVRRLAADALWTAGEHERSIAVYDCVLAADARDGDALKAKEEFLAQRHDHDGLVALLDRRAQQTEDATVRAQLLERAADLASRELNDLRRAAQLLERRATIESGRAEALDRLIEIYETLGENEAVRRMLEERLQLVRNPRDRIELYRRIGEHCAHRLADDTRAESCWREILYVVPDDREVREELIALYRRRGDFESVDRAWSAFAWRPLDDASLVAIWRAAAVNLSDNVSDAPRTLRAWRRVLDLVPDDATALVANVALERALGDRALYADTLEARGRTADASERIELWLELGRLHEQGNDATAALAVYERVLRAEPGHAAALEAAARLYGEPQAGVTRSLFELAAAHGRRGDRAAVVRRLLPLAGTSPLERFFTLRRLLALGGATPALINDLTSAASEAHAFAALAAVYEEVAAAAGDTPARAVMHDRLATLLTTRLNEPVRAFLTLASARQRVPATMDELVPLLTLAETTGRHEDAFALLGVAASVEAPLELRRAAIRRRQQLAEERLKDNARAFHQAAWLVRLDPADRTALADAERLAAAAGLWRDLDGLYAELWDHASADAERLEIARKRRDLRAGQLNDELGALDFTLVLYRLQPTRELLDELCRRADALNVRARVLPAVDGRIRQHDTSAAELAWLGAAYEKDGGHARLAFTVYGQAFLADPSATELETKLRALATATGEMLRFAHRLREAAARAADPLRAIALYGQAAELYGTLPGQDQLLLDVHRRILQLDARAFASYEVAFAELKRAGMWRELRDLMVERVERDESSDRTAQLVRQLEIARICRAELRDGEAALRAYATVLAEQPDNEEALAGVRGLTDGPMNPKLELERLRLELGRAAGARRVELLLSCANLQERELDDAPGALVTLKQLVAESGPGGAGYAPLLRLFERLGAWPEAIDLMSARADVVTDERERVELIRGAIAIAASRAVGSERAEQLNQRLLALDPSDRRARARLLQFHRRAGRWSQLAALLADTLSRLGEDASEERRLIVAERVRVLDRALERSAPPARPSSAGDDAARSAPVAEQSAEAEALVLAELERTPNDEALLVWLAGYQLRRGDRAGHAATRQRQVRLLPPRLGGLVLCHLAEMAHEAGQLEEALACYRAARTLDPDNRFAAEGLKALGRRTRNWRAQAALLPDEDAQALSLSQRAARLTERGIAVQRVAPPEALDFFERAIAIDPDAVAAWDALAELRHKLNDPAGAFAAAQAALRAAWRSAAPDPRALADEARRFAEVAALAQDDATAAIYAERAHDIDPTLPPAALAVAQRAQADGRSEEAIAILAQVLDARASLTPAQRVDASYRLGTLVARAGELDRALNHLRDGLRTDPLHPGLLHAVADVLRGKKRLAAAVQHYTQALLLANEPRRRAQLYAKLGALWDDALGAPDEAGACYDLAVSHGSDDSEVMLRALGYYRRTGRQELATRMIDRLLPRATTPTALAALWTERGSLLTALDEARAIEAFDMALSYDPACHAAVEGLAQLLEQRGEWQQLIELLEARLETGTERERAASLRRLAQLAHDKQHDDALAERYLRRAISLEPRPEDFDQLITLIGDERRDERAAVVSERLIVAGPYVPALTAAGIALAAEGQRRGAWALLSPLMATIIQDANLKALVLEVRKEYEKADTLPLLTPELHRRLMPDGAPPVLLDVLAELDGLTSFGAASLEAIGAGRCTRVDGKTALGKSFAAIAERLGLAQAMLTRAEELAVPYRIVDEAVPHVVVRADLFAMLGASETNALLAFVLEQARPGARLVAALGPTETAKLVHALFSALGREVAAGPDVEALRARIVTTAGPERLARWATELKQVEDVADRLSEALNEAARRVALVAGGELRFVAKLLGRLDDTLPKFPSTGSNEELEQFFAGAPVARRLLAFAISPTFGALLS
jgi:tetratricopeptide (TPR) repeat protein